MVSLPSSAADQLRELVELFQNNIDQYKGANYDEANTRTDFIDKFFELLGWDVRNTAGYSEQYRDVVREERIVIDNRPKAPDYGFRIGGYNKFFVEAKKPSVRIHDTADSAFQLRRYGYTAKLPLSILTNFAEFAVYDTRIKPHKDDKASTARIFYCKFEEYLANFDFFRDTYSKEAVLRGSFDRYVQENKNKRGTTEVDDDILALVEDWRMILARNIARQNPTLDTTHLNTAVQRIVDRILFLRIAEDRRIERYENLLDAAKKQGVYQHLQKLFVAADEKYNAGLFRQEDWLNHIIVDDKILSPIIKGLYYPESPYAFAVLPIEILGNIYERFLGKTIVLSPSHVAKVEEKPEVRKAGGVYYTPQYIVNYIVEETVGCKLADYLASEKSTGGLASRQRKLAGKSAQHPPTNVGGSPTILDPACGSGSFLVGAYTFLLDSYLTYYSGENKRKDSLKSGVIYEVGKDTYRLSIEEKQRILLTSIYGVDIDPIAVEVTKLSLYLKLLENETDESAGLFFKHSDLKMLPDLDKNIRCGNSLVGSDFYRNKEMPLFGDVEIRRINAFDWEKEFPIVFSPLSQKAVAPKTSRFCETGLNGANGFDCVIGNPPYSYMIAADLQEYFRLHYHHQDYQKDLYLLFLERYSMLLKDGGVFGVIISNTWLQSVTYRKIRLYLTSQYRWRKILHLPDRVFKQTVVDTHVLIFDKIKPRKSYKFSVEIYGNETATLLHKLNIQDIATDGSPINVTTPPQSRKLYDRIMRESQPLQHYCDVYNGVKPFSKGRGTPPQTDKILQDKPYVKEGSKPAGKWLPLLRGRLIHRYVNRWNKDYWILYGPCLAEPRNPMIFEHPEKIMIRQTGDSLIATLVGSGIIGRDNLHIIINRSDRNLRFYLGIINSRLLDFIYSSLNPEKGEALAQVKKIHVAQLPIPSLDLSNKKQKVQHDKLVALVDQMLSAQERLRAVVSDADRKTCAERVEILDRQIDTIVYELYGLTEEEIRIVEG